EAVKEYLMQAGIEESRMIAKGLGEANPAAPNTSTSGDDNPVGRQLNRRVEFRIVTDVPTRRVIYDSSKPGSMDEQGQNLQMDENMDEDGASDEESELGNPGSRVN